VNLYLAIITFYEVKRAGKEAAVTCLTVPSGYFSRTVDVEFLEWWCGFFFGKIVATVSKEPFVKEFMLEI
jgi:hypothetical protein